MQKRSQCDSLSSRSTVNIKFQNNTLIIKPKILNIHIIFNESPIVDLIADPQQRVQENQGNYMLEW